jgi:hypothetical protein
MAHKYQAKTSNYNKENVPHSARTSADSVHFPPVQRVNNYDCIENRIILLCK